tara:strand:+ start:889 stop:1662 length:774 start_codon:yes stop_codon:yes gene_type:complete
MSQSFYTVTEVAGNKISSEQIDRMYHRYYWALGKTKNKKVIELACGTGPGLGLINKEASSLRASDIDESLLSIAKKYYKDRIIFDKIDALSMPYKNNSIDVIILFEAIYYLENIQIFIDECIRVLKSNGRLLISTANKDLYDFNPSPYSFKYLGVRELNELLSKNNFDCSFYGYLSINEISLLQKLLRPIRKLMTKLNLFPKSMKSKEFLKKLIFGNLIIMPNELNSNYKYLLPKILNKNNPSYEYKVIYCDAKIKK